MGNSPQLGFTTNVCVAGSDLLSRDITPLPGWSDSPREQLPDDALLQSRKRSHHIHPGMVSGEDKPGRRQADRQREISPPMWLRCHNRTLQGSPAFGEAPCAPQQAGWTVACSHSRVSCWKTPGAAGSGGSVGGTLHPRGTSTFPKVSPAPHWPSTLCPASPIAVGQPTGVSPVAPSKLHLLPSLLGMSSSSSAWGQSPSVLPAWEQCHGQAEHLLPDSMQLTGARSWEEQIQALPAQEVSDFPSPVAGKLVRGWPYRSARGRFPKSLSCLWLPLQSMEVLCISQSTGGFPPCTSPQNT